MQTGFRVKGTALLRGWRFDGHIIRRENRDFVGGRDTWSGLFGFPLSFSVYGFIAESR